MNDSQDRVEILQEMAAAIERFDCSEITLYALIEELRASIEALHWALDEKELLRQAWQLVERAHLELMGLSDDPTLAKIRSREAADAIDGFKTALASVAALPEPSVDAVVSHKELAWAEQSGASEGALTGRSHRWALVVGVAAPLFGMALAVIAVLWMSAPKETHGDAQVVSEPAPEGELHLVASLAVAGSPNKPPTRLVACAVSHSFIDRSGQVEGRPLADCPELLFDRLATKLDATYPSVDADFRRIVRMESFMGSDLNPPSGFLYAVPATVMLTGAFAVLFIGLAVRQLTRRAAP